jgi:hypothetical protein
MEIPHYTKQPGKVIVELYKIFQSGKPTPISRIGVALLRSICVVKTDTTKRVVFCYWQDANQT